MPATKTTRKKPQEVKTRIADITPGMAENLLKKNTHNRPIQEQTVLKYAGAIRRGEWTLNGEAIQVAKDGALLNGQHRLLAVVKAKKPIKAVLVTGLPNAAQETMDVGAKRTLGHMLSLRGEKNASRLGGAISLIYTYTKIGQVGNKALNPQPTPQQLLKFFDADADAIRDHLYPPYKKMVDNLLTPSTSSALFYLFSKVDQEDAELFFHYLATGSSLSEDDPIYLLRERLLREQQKPHGRILPPVRAALSIKAFNIWRAGMKLGTLKWKGGGANSEPYPRVEDCEIVPEKS